MKEITELRGKSNPQQTIREHTDLLIKALKQYLKIYPNIFTESEIQLIEFAAEYHDYGKSIYPFQKLVKNSDCISSDLKNEIEAFYRKYPNSERIPHGYLSVTCLNLKELETLFDDQSIKVLANAIYYHHVRDYPLTENDCKEILNNDLRKRYPDYKFRISTKCKPYKTDQALDEAEWEKYAVVKGMLNRLDYWASANTDVDFEIDPKDDDGRTAAQLVEEKLISVYGGLRDVQLYMKAHREDNLAVVASTGIGKTEAALMWTGGSKTFYTLPLIVSINAIYERIGEYGYGVEVPVGKKDGEKTEENRKVSLLHSDAMAYLMEKEESENDDPQLKYQTTRRFSYPLTVCTVDQLFTFVYKYRGCEQLLATLKYSKLIIDEIQAYSPAIAAKIIYGLKLIADVGGKFAIITATLPPVFKHFMEQYDFAFIEECNENEKKEAEEKAKKEHKHIIYTRSFLLDKKRHKIDFNPYRDGVDFDCSLIAEKGKTQKVLVLCNTVKKAQEVYQRLKDEGTDPYLLHSQFIKNHRKMIEDKIREFSDREKHPEPGIWVSTQIVEASLDIDFDVLFTEMCTADSLLQRMGRCWRKREYEKNEPNVYIYDTQNGVKEEIYDKTIYKRSVDELKPYLGKIFTEAEKAAYIDVVFDSGALNGSAYFEELREILKKCSIIPFGGYDKETALQQFRGIDSVTVIPECVYIDNAADIEKNIGIIEEEIDKNDPDKRKKYQGKILAKNRLDGLTLSLHRFSAKTKWNDKIKMVRVGKTDIYRNHAVYNFDEKTCKGLGLINSEDKDTRFF